MLKQTTLEVYPPLRNQYPKVIRPLWTAAPDIDTNLNVGFFWFGFFSYIWKAKQFEKNYIPASWRLFGVSSFHSFRPLFPLPSYFLPVVLIFFIPEPHLFCLPNFSSWPKCKANHWGSLKEKVHSVRPITQNGGLFCSTAEICFN